MPRFVPFAALRYAEIDRLPQLIAPPYDVLSEADVDQLQSGDEHNITFVDVPRGDENRYLLAAEKLAKWQAIGVLVADPEPSFTIYRLSFVDEAGAAREIAGVLGGLEVVDLDSGGVLPHERTTPKASTDRLDLTRATGANLSPVWGLSLTAGLAALLAEPGELVGEVTEDGVTHRVERVSDPGRVAAIAAAVDADEVLIADGHHRYSISRTYRDEIRAATGQTDTAAEETLTFVSELVADQLSVAAIHRLYNGVTAEELIHKLAERFEIEVTDPPSPETLSAMEQDGYLILHTAKGTWRLIPHPGAFADVRALDGAWLEAALAGLEHTVTYQHGLTEAVAAVASGAAVATVLIRPVSVAEIERTARERLLMPPKSTFFTPKLKTGFVIRPVEGH